MLCDPIFRALAHVRCYLKLDSKLSKMHKLTPECIRCKVVTSFDFEDLGFVVVTLYAISHEGELCFGQSQ
jgi:hypothetical protein